MEEVEIETRCKRICGDDAPCFTDNKKQISCISDMVINKVWPVKGLIDAAVKKNECSEVADILDIANNSIDELIEWVKHLQAEHHQRSDVSQRSFNRIAIFPDIKDRVQTGVIQFGDDWPGVFLRGGDAAPHGFYLDSLLNCIERGETPDPIAIGLMRGLSKTLCSCKVQGK